MKGFHVAKGLFQTFKGIDFCVFQVKLTPDIETRCLVPISGNRSYKMSSSSCVMRSVTVLSENGASCAPSSPLPWSPLSSPLASPPLPCPCRSEFYISAWFYNYFLFFQGKSIDRVIALEPSSDFQSSSSMTGQSEKVEYFSLFNADYLDTCKSLRVSLYIEDITWSRGDTKFLFYPTRLIGSSARPRLFRAWFSGHFHQINK